MGFWLLLAKAVLKARREGRAFAWGVQFDHGLQARLAGSRRSDLAI